MMKSILRASVNCLPHGIRHRIKHIPGVAGFQRWLVNRVLSGAPFLHTINSGPAAGLRFEVTLPLDKAIWAGNYEPEFSEAISQGVKDGDVCYDVGGYRGYMSGVMALAGASRVLVFEPLPANQKALQRLCGLNPALSVELKPIAVGNIDGSIRLQVMPDPSMGKLVTSTFQAGATVAGEIDVDIRRLDSLVQGQEIPPPQVIKVDVEGAELDVLLGAVGVLRASRPLVFLEAHSAALEEACSQELARHGYRIRRLELNPGGEDQTRHLIAYPDHE
jgi:FkbM family methyltransferase